MASVIQTTWPKTYPDSVTLSLTGEEAATLLVLTAFVSGNEKNSPRKHVDSIYNALSVVLGDYRKYAEYKCIDTMTIHFEEYGTGVSS